MSGYDRALSGKTATLLSYLWVSELWSNLLQYSGMMVWLRGPGYSYLIIYIAPTGMSSRWNMPWKLLREVRAHHTDPSLSTTNNSHTTTHNNRNLRSRRKRQRRRRHRLRETLRPEAPRHPYHALQDRRGGQPRHARLCRSERRCPYPHRQGPVRSPVAPLDRRGPRDYRLYLQVHCQCAAAVYSEWWCETVWD